MKYKIGDKVRVVWLEDYQTAFKIGDIVTITTEHPDGTPPHYSVDIGGDDIWWLNDKEIELYEEPKMTKYTTEPIDYTGCHPVIAEHLKRGEAILCRVWKNEKGKYTNFLVTNFLSGAVSEYRGHFRSDPESNLYWRYAEPIPVKRKVLMSAEKAVVKLIENGWKIDTDGRVNSPTETKDYYYYYLSELKRKEGKHWDTCKGFPDYLFEEVDD